MPDLITRRLWLHEETDKAILVGTSQSHRDQTNVWLPRSLIAEVRRDRPRNPRADAGPGASQYLGVLLTFEAPSWLIEREGLTTDVVQL